MADRDWQLTDMDDVTRMAAGMAKFNRHLVCRRPYRLGRGAARRDNEHNCSDNEGDSRACHTFLILALARNHGGMLAARKFSVEVGA
jgi:hypothetical protein